MFEYGLREQPHDRYLLGGGIYRDDLAFDAGQLPGPLNGVLQIADAIHQAQDFGVLTGVNTPVGQLLDGLKIDLAAFGNGGNELLVKAIDEAFQNLFLFRGHIPHR